MLEYSKYSLIHKQGFSVFGFSYIPTQAVFSKVILYINYMLVAHTKELSKLDTNVLLLSMLGILGFWTWILELSGKYYIDSKRNIRSWKTFKGHGLFTAKVFRKWAKSCRPLSAGYDGLFEIRPKTVLKFLRSVATGTFKCLLALKGKL